MKNLNLNKQKVTELSSTEMENVEGGAGWWSDVRSGNCSYSDANQTLECIQVYDAGSNSWYSDDVCTGCNNS